VCYTCTDFLIENNLKSFYTCTKQKTSYASVAFNILISCLEGSALASKVILPEHIHKVASCLEDNFDDQACPSVKMRRFFNHEI